MLSSQLLIYIYYEKFKSFKIMIKVQQRFKNIREYSVKKLISSQIQTETVSFMSNICIYIIQY